MTYRELMSLRTFDERFHALAPLAQQYDRETPEARRLKQTLYQTQEWSEVRDFVVARDGGKDLACGSDILGPVYVHHTIPVTSEMLERRDPRILDPNYLISVSKGVHEALHSGNEYLIPKDQYTERTPNDTIPWR